MISIHYTTLMHCNQNTNTTRQHTPHNKANHRKIAFSTPHSTTQRNPIRWRTHCRRWRRASSRRRPRSTSPRTTPSRRRVWIRISFIAMMIIKWIIMIIVMMTYWHHIITITIRRKKSGRVKRRRDNPTFSEQTARTFPVTISISPNSLTARFSIFRNSSRSSINELLLPFLWWRIESHSSRKVFLSGAQSREGNRLTEIFEIYLRNWLRHDLVSASSEMLTIFFFIFGDR